MFGLSLVSTGFLKSASISWKGQKDTTILRCQIMLGAYLQGYAFCLRNKDHDKDESHAHNDTVHPENETSAEIVPEVEEGLGHQEGSRPVGPCG